VRPLLAGAATLLSLGGCTFGAPRGATDQGRDIAGLYQFMFWIAIGVAAIVYGLIVWSVVRYRRKNENLPKQTRYHGPLEITYTVIPILIVIGIFIATYSTEKKVDRVVDHPDLVVHVTAFQWQWRFQYPDSGIQVVGTPGHAPQLVLPVGKTVRIDLTAQDVIHAFFVPQFLFKRDAIPGHPNRFDLRITNAGTFHGECAEFCGLNHAFMSFSVKAVPMSDFQRWVQEQRSAQAGQGQAG